MILINSDKILQLISWNNMTFASRELQTIVITFVKVFFCQYRNHSSIVCSLDWYGRFIECTFQEVLETEWSSLSILYRFFLYACVSSAIVLKTEYSKQRYMMFRSDSVEGQASCSNERYLLLQIYRVKILQNAYCSIDIWISNS
jgi:hypothetical protein